MTMDTFLNKYRIQKKNSENEQGLPIVSFSMQKTFEVSYPKSTWENWSSQEHDKYLRMNLKIGIKEMKTRLEGMLAELEAIKTD